MERYSITADRAREKKSNAPEKSMDEMISEMLESIYHEISDVAIQGGEALSFSMIGTPNVDLLMPGVIKDLTENGFTVEMLYGDYHVSWK